MHIVNETGQPIPAILASASPRRAELLSSLLDDFEILPANLNEDAYVVADPDATARALACAKARAVAGERPQTLVIAADTVVFVDGIQLAKPNSLEEAATMLARLSHKTHTVITGVCIILCSRESCFSEETRVTFRKLSRAEISEYVATGEPMDKAGAYAIQGRAQSFVETVEGSLSNVIGLPMEALASRLKEFSASIQAGRS